MKWTSQQTAATKFGMIVALGALVVSTAGTEITWRAMSSENQAFIQQSIGDTAGLVASHVRSEVEHLNRQLLSLGESELRVAYLKHRQESLQGQAQPDPLAVLPGVGSIDADPDVLDVALWSRVDAQSLPVRNYLGLNSRFESTVPDLLTKIQLAENIERTQLAPAFQGHPVVIRHDGIDPRGMVFVAVPVGHGLVSEVLAAHVRPDRFQRALRQENMVHAFLVDSRGSLLVSTSRRSGPAPAEAQLIEQAREPGRASIASDQLRYVDSQGHAHYGGFHRVPLGQLSVLATIPDSEARSGLAAIRVRSVVFTLFAFFASFLAAYAYAMRRQRGAVPGRGKGSFRAAGAPTRSTGSSQIFVSTEKTLAGTEASHAPLAERLPVTVLRGQLGGMAELVETLPPEELAEAIIDVLTLASSRVAAYEGRFQAHSGSAFTAVWGAPGTESNETWRALRCALDLRKDIAALNASRRLDGQRPLFVTIGIHADSGLAARLGPSGRLEYAVAGEVHACAGALASLAALSGVDFLASQSVWQQSEAHFIGECLGEAKLTADTGLNGYYWVAGYRDEQGHEVLVDSPEARRELAGEEPPPVAGPAVVAPIRNSQRALRRWLINNGSQMVGPYNAEQIASQLFAQELDFDSECWAEGTGASSQIRDAGIFTGSEDDGASFWIYDGKTIHGPLSRGFLSTAAGRGAIPPEAFVCEGSTVEGWRPVAEWVQANPAAPASLTMTAPESMARLESDLLAAAAQSAALSQPSGFAPAPPVEHASPRVREDLEALAALSAVPPPPPEPTARNPEEDSSDQAA